MNYYEHHLGDYMRDTAHLSLIEDGIYRRLIDAYYAREKPLPNDVAECSRLARISSKIERRALQNVLKEFFSLGTDGFLHQKKCDEVIEKYNSKKNKARASAEARWSAERTDSERNATGMRTHCEGNAPNLQSPVTSNQTPEALRAPEALNVRVATKITPEGEMAIALRNLGVVVKSTDPVLHGWVKDFTVQQATDAVGIARIRKPHPEAIPANYLDKILRQPARPPPSTADRVTWRPPPDEEVA